MFSSLEILSPMIESVDDSKQLPIVNVAIPFCWSEALRKKCTGMEVSIVILLHEYSSAGKKGSISHANKRATDIREMKDWGGLEFLEEGVTVEGPPTSFSPFSSANCTMLSHFSFNDFIAIAFPDLAGDLNIQL